MRHHSLIVTVFLAALSLAGCSNQANTNARSPSPTPTAVPTPDDPKRKAAANELKEQDDAYQNFPKIDRLAVRNAASDFVRTEFPDWTLKGLSAETYDWNVAWVDADIEKGTRRRLVSLIVKHFYPESGEPYWKGFPLDKGHASQLRDMREAEITRQLNDAKDKVERYESGERP